MNEITIYRNKEKREFSSYVAAAKFLNMTADNLRVSEHLNRELPRGWSFTPPPKNGGLSPEEFIKKHCSNMSIAEIAEALEIPCKEVRAIYDAHYIEWEGGEEAIEQKKYKGKHIVAIPINGGSEIHYQAIGETRLYGFKDSGIYECIKGKKKAYKGFIWKWAEEEET